MSLWSRFFRSSVGEQYQKGIRYFNEGDYDQAVRCLEEVVACYKSRESPIAKLSAFYAAEARSKLGVAEFHRVHSEGVPEVLFEMLKQQKSRLEQAQAKFGDRISPECFGQ